MRIGIDIRNIGKYLSSTFSKHVNLVKNLAKIDDRNEYFLFTDILDENVLAEISQKFEISGNPNFKIIPLKSPNKFCWNLRTLPNYLKKNPVDVYHTQYITPFFVSKNIKIITHVHDVSFLAYPEFIKKSDLFFLKLLIPKSLKRADKVIAVSEFTKKEIIKYYGIDSEKIEVVYNAASEEFLQSDYSGEELFAIRRKYNLPEKYILYIGTMQPRKNIPMLIGAFAEIKKSIPEIRLVLAGNINAHNFDGRIEKEIKRLNLSNEVIFPGFVEEKDKSALFQLAEVFVFPSLYEGFGIPILEAMSMKLPVLSSNIPVHIEIAEEASLYFDPLRLDDFSEKLYNSLTDQNLREKSIYLGYQRAMLFSWEKSAEKVLNIYKSIN